MTPLTYEDLAGMVDFHLLSPELTEVQVGQGCEVASRASCFSVIVRPCDIDVATRILTSATRPASVCGFPAGDSNTGVKLYEIRDLLRRGAREIEMVLNVSKLLSRQFQHVETEIQQAADACHKESAKLTVIFPAFPVPDELQIIACRICSRAEVDLLSTGTLPGVTLLRAHVPEWSSVKLAGVDALEAALAACEAGVARIGSSAAPKLLNEWKLRLTEQARQAALKPAS